MITSTFDDREPLVVVIAEDFLQLVELQPRRRDARGPLGHGLSYGDGADMRGLILHEGEPLPFNCLVSSKQSQGSL